MILLPDEQCSRVKPRNLSPADEELFSHEYQKAFGPTVSQTITNVGILPNGFLYADRVLLPQSFALAPSGLRRVKVAVRGIQHLMFSPDVTNIEHGLFATDEFSNGYFHWVCDVLPRIETLASTVPGELAARTLVVPAMADFPYLRPSLQPFEAVTFHVLGKRERAVCSSLFIVPAVAPTGNYRPALMRSLRDRFRRFFGADGGKRRIYVSRSRASRRRIANEGDILPVLVHHGFESVRLEELSFAEQVRLVGSASILVGNHGAGLTNIAWLAPGSRVLELRRRGDGQNNCFFSLASALDVAYSYNLCDSVEDRESTHSADLLVDPQMLDETLESISD